MILQVLDNLSDPPSQKAALIFFQRCVSVWGRLPGQPSVEDDEANNSLPGFERFIYERLVPALFRVPSLPGFNIKDGQVMMVSLVIIRCQQIN